MIVTSQKATPHPENKLIMSDSHFSNAFDSLSDLESSSTSFIHLKDFLTFVSERAENGENVEDHLYTAIGLLEYAIEKFDKQFAQVWREVIVNHPTETSIEE
jgi:hypothetical protein